MCGIIGCWGKNKNFVEEKYLFLLKSSGCGNFPENVNTSCVYTRSQKYEINFFESLPLSFLPEGAIYIYIYLRDRMWNPGGAKELSLRGLCASPSGSLLTCDGKKARLRIASLNWRIENNRAIPSRRGKKKGEENKRKKRREQGESSARECKTHRGRLVALYSHKAWPREEKNVSGPTGPSLSLSLPSSSSSSARPSAALPTSLFLNEHLLSGKTVWQLARARALDLTPRLVKHHFHTTEKQFNSLVSLFSRVPSRHPSSLSISFSLAISFLTFVVSYIYRRTLGRRPPATPQSPSHADGYY